jgi:hypothetical protein
VVDELSSQDLSIGNLLAAASASIARTSPAVAAQ